MGPLTDGRVQPHDSPIPATPLSPLGRPLLSLSRATGKRCSLPSAIGELEQHHHRRAYTNANLAPNGPATATAYHTQTTTATAIPREQSRWHVGASPRTTVTAPRIQANTPPPFSRQHSSTSRVSCSSYSSSSGTPPTTHHSREPRTIPPHERTRPKANHASQHLRLRAPDLPNDPRPQQDRVSTPATGSGRDTDADRHDKAREGLTCAAPQRDGHLLEVCAGRRAAEPLHQPVLRLHGGRQRQPPEMLVGSDRGADG